MERVNVEGKQAAVNAAETGTKCAAVHCFTLQPRSHAIIHCRLCHVSCIHDVAFGKQFDTVFCSCRHECHDFYSQVSDSFAPQLP